MKNQDPSKTGKGKGNPRGKYTNRKRVRESDDSKAYDTRRANSANDPNWYLVNGQLAKDVASFSFNTALGDRIMRTALDHGSIGLMPSPVSVPGIASILVGPSVGVSNWENSPVNVAAKDVYSFVRHANSGHANYDTPDLMLYLLAADSVQTYWSYMVRALGVMGTYSQLNRYIGDAMLTAMGINPSDLRQNIAQFRAYINQFAIKASVLAVPNTMTYFIRHQWMFQNIYLDEDSAKAQMYMYVPAFLYKYALDSSGAGCLTPELVGGSITSSGYLNAIAYRTFTDLKNIGDALINAMLSQEDVGIMSGDILKAYGSDKLFRFAQVDENYAISPVFSEEVLMQIHNTNFLGGFAAYNDGTKFIVDFQKALEVTQDTSIGSGILKFEPAFINAQRTCYSQILDFWKAEVTPEMSLVASRNKAMCATTGGSVETKSGTVVTNGVACYLQTCGSEMVFNAWILQYDPVLRTLNQNPVYGVGAGTAATINTNIPLLMSCFNEFPILDTFASLQTGLPYGELSNYTLLNFSDINDMHHSALLSLFGVPYRW